MRHDEWLAQQNAGMGPMPYPQQQPEIIIEQPAYQPGQVPWADPNATDATVQDPSLDAQVYDTSGATTDDLG